jgi:rSAM/selenodomain-associated transferase 1
MLGDAADEISSVPRIARYLFLDPPVAANVLRGAPFSSFERFPQRGKDLGEKMWDAAATAFRLGAMRVVIVGGDCPALAAERLRRAFRELREGAEAVFGPSADGGYYLVGLACPDERLFRKFTWSTPTVLLDAVARCRALSIPFSFLPPERDVDTWEDLLALREWARTRGRARPACPRTREWITGFFGPGGGGFPGSPERTPGPPRGSRSRPGG